MDAARALLASQATWEHDIVPTLFEYIGIMNKSPAFDKNWKANGYMDQAIDLFVAWAEVQTIDGLTVEVLELDGRTPLIFIEIAATDGSDITRLCYGHLDKQPEMSGWREGLGPWTPVLEDGKLYGRGGADDGYAMFAALTAVRLAQEQGELHPRIVIIIEASEESGSPDLIPYMETFADKIGKPELVICLDSGAGNYDQLWLTTSLRGLVAGDLTVNILTEGVHSGNATGVVPDSFNIMRTLLQRLDNGSDGMIPRELWVDIPDDREAQATYAAKVLGDVIFSEFPWVEGAEPEDIYSAKALLIRKTWHPGLAVIGMQGFPATLSESGNVLRPGTTARLSIRLPPTADAQTAFDAVKEILEADPPYGAEVTFTQHGQANNGWNAPTMPEWLEESIANASQQCFGQPFVAMGEGGSIPFMGYLGKMFPEAQFVVTGVLGPQSNAHGPNEFLHVGMAARLTAVVAMILTDPAR